MKKITGDLRLARGQKTARKTCWSSWPTSNLQKHYKTGNLVNFANLANIFLVIAKIDLIRYPSLPLKSVAETETDIASLSLEVDSYATPDALTQVRTARTIISVRVD